MSDDKESRHTFAARAAEHGKVRAVLEGFAYLPPFNSLFHKEAPYAAESYWYCMGGLTFLMFIFLTVSGTVLALFGPYWWLQTPAGLFFKSFHYWAAQAFFFFLLLHLFRVWAVGAYRGKRYVNWLVGLVTFLLALAENLFGLLSRGDWESQFVSMHSGDMLFSQPIFLHLLSPANFAADLTIHIALIPVILVVLILAHVTLVRLQGIARPL